MYISYYNRPSFSHIMLIHDSLTDQLLLSKIKQSVILLHTQLHSTISSITNHYYVSLSLYTSIIITEFKATIIAVKQYTHSSSNCCRAVVVSICVFFCDTTQGKPISFNRIQFKQKSQESTYVVSAHVFKTKIKIYNCIYWVCVEGIIKNITCWLQLFTVSLVATLLEQLVTLEMRIIRCGYHKCLNQFRLS